MMFRCGTHAVVVLLCLAVSPAARAQTPGDTLLRAAGPQYEAGALKRTISGSNWRETWTAPLSVPVLDVRTFAGGLTPERRGGGNQSMTLHLVDASGRDWIFRSIDKYPQGALPAEIHATPVGAAISDHVSILFPGSHFIMPTLLGAVGILHVQPHLFIMPDDGALGEFREAFAGMLGEIELRTDEGRDNTPGFAGSRAIKGTEEFFNDLEDSQRHRLDEHELLRARLVDFLAGDPDRGTDQWRWARFDGRGHYIWRPIPVDRDWAFVRADGLLARLARSVFGKLTRFSDDFPALDALTHSSHLIDRRLLTRLTRDDFAAAAQQVMAALNDDVIDSAVAALPPEYAALNADWLAERLKARRRSLPRIASDFHDLLATDVDVRGTDEDDLAEIERRSDGSVLVRIGPRPSLLTHPQQEPDTDTTERAAASPDPYYERVFHPRHTREVRIYLHGGADHARVTGARTGPIRIRILGGGGDDLLEDLAGAVRFYDHRGQNLVVRASGTRFSDQPWSMRALTEGLRSASDWLPDWGRDRRVMPTADYDSRLGPLIGAGLSVEQYGFRRVPHQSELRLRALHAPVTGASGGDLRFDYRLQNSRRGLLVDAAAWKHDRFRFHGFGNDVQNAGATLSDVRYDHVRVAARMHWQLGPRPGRPVPDDDSGQDGEDVTGEESALQTGSSQREIAGMFSVGPSFGWTDPQLNEMHPASDVTNSDAVSQLGMRAALDLRRTDRADVPRRGFRVNGRADAYPIVSGPAGAFGSVALQTSAYVPLIGSGPHLALSVGGERVSGEFPIFEAAFLGGRHTLRSQRSERFAGDASLYGTAELRVPVDTLTLMVRAEAGVLVFGDAGRVWYRGASTGGWHKGYGAGGWFSTLGTSVSVAVARSGGTRAYLWLGMPF